MEASQRGEEADAECGSDDDGNKGEDEAEAVGKVEV